MKFTYEYRTKDNAVHSGVVSASDRDAAYAALKARGVRPSRLAEAPGFANKLFGKGKRWLAIGALALLLVVVIVALVAADRRADRLVGADRRAARLEEEARAPLTRRQIYGDPALMEKLLEENYATVFADEGDRVLAHFAQPAHLDRYVTSLRRDRRARARAAQALGNLIAVRQDAAPTDSPPRRGGIPAAPQTKTNPSTIPHSSFLIPHSPDASSRERSELIRIVRWMRGEFSAYLANGLGTPESYLGRLLERQVYEEQFLTRARRELEGEKDPAVWEKRNDELRAIGAPTLTPPSGEGRGREEIRE